MKIKKGPKKGGWNQFVSQIITAILIFLIIIFIYNSYQNFVAETEEVEEISISELAGSIRLGEVSEITVRGDEIEALFKDDSNKTTIKEPEIALSETLALYGVTPDDLSGVLIRAEAPSGARVWLIPVLSIFAPIAFILFLFWILSKQMRGSTMQAFSFGQSKARVIDPKDKNQRITFKDVAGAKEAKEELTEIVDFLRSPKKFIDIGARIPKGVLLMGPPGTGKTLLARAVAGEANVPFFYLSGSEFVEMFVGVGASRVRDLFKMAKRAAPAIIFIDEIDAVGRHRGTGIGGGHDEREQTLNQILVELDGFEPNEKVIVISATNRPDVLDPALLRTGRFDRRVFIDLPDIRDREEILKIHSNKKILGEDVDLHVIAERTPGFSGADLANLMNEGAILAARENRQKVTQFDFIRSVEKVMLGPERKSRLFSRKEKEIVAYHEGGHALIASVLPHADPVHKVTVVSRGHAGGYTLKLPLEERRLQSKKEFLDDIVVSLGGYAAEKMIFNDLTTGASNDIAMATALARDMVTRYGMSDTIGPVSFEESAGPLYKEGRVVLGEKHYSEDISAQVDKEVSMIMSKALEQAEGVLKKYKKVLLHIAKELQRIETLEREEFEEILIVNGIQPKKREGDDEYKTEKAVQGSAEKKKIKNI